MSFYGSMLNLRNHLFTFQKELINSKKQILLDKKKT